MTAGDHAFEVAAVDNDGDADFVANNGMNYTTYGNAQFFVSAANWLTEGEDAVELPLHYISIRILPE